MICLACAETHPQFKPLEQPAPLQEMACQGCGEMKLCVPNHKVGLPETFMTVDEAFRLIAANIINPPKESP